MSLKSGHKILPISGDDGKKLYEEFKRYKFGTMILGPDRWFFTSTFLEYADRIYDFEFKPTDVVIMSFPKCGTTWMQEIVWTLINNPNLDNPKADISINFRCPNLECDHYAKTTPNDLFKPGSKLYEMFTQTYPERDPEDGIFLQLTQQSEDPRVIKTHLPFCLLSPNLLNTCKVIYLTREPKDVAVSFYYFMKGFSNSGFCGSIDSFIDHFINGYVLGSPFWSHLQQAWTKRLHENLHFCYYEDLKAEPKREISTIGNFIGLDRTENQIEKISQHTTFSSMRTRNNYLEDIKFSSEKYVKEGKSFFRKGKSGNWKSELTEDQIKKLDQWTKNNVEIFDGDFKYKRC